MTCQNLVLLLALIACLFIALCRTDSSCASWLTTLHCVVIVIVFNEVALELGNIVWKLFNDELSAQANPLQFNLQRFKAVCSHSTYLNCMVRVAKDRQLSNQYWDKQEPLEPGVWILRRCPMVTCPNKFPTSGLSGHPENVCGRQGAWQRILPNFVKMSVFIPTSYGNCSGIVRGLSSLQAHFQSCYHCGLALDLVDFRIYFHYLFIFDPTSILIGPKITRNMLCNPYVNSYAKASELFLRKSRSLLPGSHIY